MRYSDEFKNEVVKEYESHRMTIGQISAVYGVGRRSVYKWLVESNVPRKRAPKTERRCVFMTKDEVEAVLLLMKGTDLSGKHGVASKVLQKRLVHVAEMFDGYGSAY